MKEKVKFDSSSLIDAHTLQGNEVKYQYAINNENGNKTHLELYVSSYVDNTANGSQIIMSIYKVS